MDALFEVADSKMSDEQSKKVLANLRQHVAQLEQDLYRPQPKYMDAFFFPNMDNVKKLVRYISMAKKTLLVCVFNLTNDDLANAVLDRWNAGVDVRIITDDECMKNKGNDCQYLADQGIPVRIDDSEQYHMHNKFMVVDTEFLLTGSFNWTFQAGKSNQENLLVVDHPFYLQKYINEFDKLWTQFDKNEVERRENYAARKIQGSYRSKQQKRNAQQAKQSNSKPQPVKGKSAPGFEFKGW
jgi:phosphatidylserine/phosphatidylglycerophosphate/cardiolipin synthase-like enzyme